MGLVVGIMYFLVVLVLGTGLLGIGFLIGKKSRFTRDGYSGFECGFQSMSSARLPFSLKFYLVAIIFLLFDVELILILPYFMSGGMAALMFFFFSILLWGLIHECNEGSLEWAM
uniref:NADH-ubiquinone oxidoreductase chain 3 n=1 Tax=Fulvia mutica TaxID=80828 RepID=T2HIK4_FULMU|nr:NADH dehydrogenase subunit 3 [Fulvia mutica]BAN79050.1 NADH dehydrogenase subunit 3 [Fulvia mutica]